ncbi:MAG: hypothetical protein WDN72_09615 [Alphaproteobacteria bacterium]
MSGVRSSWLIEERNAALRSSLALSAFCEVASASAKDALARRVDGRAAENGRGDDGGRRCGGVRAGAAPCGRASA